MFLSTASILVLGMAMGAGIEQWRMTALLNAERADTAVQLQRIAEASAKAFAEQQQARQALEAQLQTIDSKNHKELTDAKAEAARLVADLRDARQRLRVRIAAPACSGEVPEASGAASLDDGTGTAELHPATAADLAALAGDADACVVTLTGLQEWARAATETDRE